MIRIDTGIKADSSVFLVVDLSIHTSVVGDCTECIRQYDKISIQLIGYLGRICYQDRQSRQKKINCGLMSKKSIPLNIPLTTMK